jgi:DNA-binding CsgD family transcriptional regulator
VRSSGVLLCDKLAAVPRLADRDRRRVAEIATSLSCITDSPRSALRDAVFGLESVLDAQSYAYGIAPTDNGLEIDFFYPGDCLTRFGERNIQRDMNSMFDATPRSWGCYDALHPEPKQRNRAMTLSQMLRTFNKSQTTGSPSVREKLYRKWGVYELDNLRILICDGPRLLANIGAWRYGPFTSRERHILHSLTPIVRKRLRLERQLQSSALAWAALEVSLEAVSAPAFLLDSKRRVRHANRAAVALLERNPSVFEEAADSRSPDYQVTRLRMNGTPEYLLVIGKPTLDGLPSRLALASARWRLTPRQVEVLSLVAQGRPNKTISAILVCGESTVEFHVSAILKRSTAESRAELVARFWTLS